MFVQMRKTVVKEGFAEQVLERFKGEGAVEKQEGFIDLSVMVKKVRNGEEEIIVMIRWESEEYWNQWEKSDIQIANQKAKQGKSIPEYIVSAQTDFYEVKAEKKAVQ